MNFLACLLLALPADSAPPQGAAPVAPPRPEAVLFARAMVVGHDISGGFGLDKELGAPGELSDVVTASLLFAPKSAVEGRSFADVSVATQQIQSAVENKASLVIALDYLMPYVYGPPVADEVRTQRVAAALKALEVVTCPLVLGDIPDLRSALEMEKPSLAQTQVPSVAALQALNASVTTWAAARKDVVIAPIAATWAHVHLKEAFTIRRHTWGQSWLSDLMQTDRVHTRLHGTIALWLTGLDALCLARKDLDPTAFDWNALSIYKKVYAAKARARDEAVQKQISKLRIPPSRPPPQLPPPVNQDDEEARAKERKKANGQEEGSDG